MLCRRFFHSSYLIVSWKIIQNFSYKPSNIGNNQVLRRKGFAVKPHRIYVGHRGRSGIKRICLYSLTTGICIFCNESKHFLTKTHSAHIHLLSLVIYLLNVHLITFFSNTPRRSAMPLRNTKRPMNKGWPTQGPFWMVLHQQQGCSNEWQFLKPSYGEGAEAYDAEAFQLRLCAWYMPGSSSGNSLSQQYCAIRWKLH